MQREVSSIIENASPNGLLAFYFIGERKKDIIVDFVSYLCISFRSFDSEINVGSDRKKYNNLSSEFDI